MVSSGFWNIRQLVTVVSADDGMEDSNEDEEEDGEGERVQEIGMHTAPNGKRYAIMYDANSPTYMFRRPDGSLSS